MLHKISIALLFVFISTKVLSQDIFIPNQKAGSHAVIEIKTVGGNFNKSEKEIIYFDDNTLVDITNKLYARDDIAVAQKALACIKYMAGQNYTLISSTSIVEAASGYGSRNINQYIFEKKEK